jgi:hypothetical protein
MPQRRRPIESLLEIAPKDVRTGIDRVWKKLDRADFEGAFRIFQPLVRRYAGDYFVTRFHAMLLGDSAEALPPAKRRMQKRQACRVLRSLLRTPVGDPPKGVPLRDWFTVRNELYFHSGQWAKQAALGKRHLRTVRTGAYACTVGNAWRAARYHCAGKPALARKYAREALRISPRAKRAFPGFYNLHVHIALAAGIAKGRAAAEKELAVAKRLSGKSDDHYEFREVREVLDARKLPTF